MNNAAAIAWSRTSAVYWRNIQVVTVMWIATDGWGLLGVTGSKGKEVGIRLDADKHTGEL